MAPPYKNAYSYFRADAIEFIKANRTWTSAQRAQTISSIWAGNQHVKDYYANHTRPQGRWLGRSPGLPNPNPIPAVPFTATDVDRTKSAHTMPVPAAPVSPIAAVPTAAPAAMPVVAPVYVDSQLHDFWPRLPWSTEPDMAPFSLEAIKNKHHPSACNAWLDTEPYMPPPSDESHWHGMKLLATGGYGAAGLWVEVDATNNISDRMVIKEANTFTKSAWRDPKNWRDRLPREIRIHELLEERRAVDPAMCRHIIRLRAHRLFMRLRRYRLYLDYYAGGDLNCAMKQCADNWKDGKDGANEDMIIPEGFVWYTIKALAEACLLLQNGTTSEIPVDGWRPITHLDLRLPNVLLNLNNPLAYEGMRKTAAGSSNSADADSAEEHPVVPVLADFGISFFSPKSDGCPISDNPDQYITSVDTRYPPEMHQQAEPYDIRLGEKTDVWGIGNIAWTLIANRQDDAGPFRCESWTPSATFAGWDGHVPLAIQCDRNNARHDDSDVLMAYSKTNPAANEYGPQIKELVRTCLNYEQDDRPTLKEIIAEAEQFLSDPDNHTFVDQIHDKDGLNLTLPDFPEFAIEESISEVKRIGRAENDDETPSSI
ncbi:hypothetical protein G6011_04029 [Alternaria panax]|uniref:Protein kinase domain-containing protein n=1 Tax=Alternaria panax TaxID=48097 RepID=A0AAD4IGD0_9PLEO|nr:hypothetical protein G6011_04029 [Alternaria panax]